MGSSKQNLTKTSPHGMFAELTIANFLDEAREARKTLGKSDLYPMKAFPGLTQYLSGGFGREGSYELIVLAGKCVEENTLIKYRSSTCVTNCSHNIPIKRLYKRFQKKQNETLYVRSFNEETGEVQWSEVVNVLDMGAKECWRVTLANGQFVEATDEHRFSMQDYSWKQLKDVRVGDKILVCPTAVNGKGGKRRIANKEYYVHYHPHASSKVVNGITYYRLSAHRAVYEANMNGLSLDSYIKLLNNYDGREIKFITEGLEIHHKDGDHFNNELDNLELLTKQQHAQLGVQQSINNIKMYAIASSVVSIEKVGTKHVYDIACEGNHNFWGNGIWCHNTGHGKSSFALQMVLDSAMRGDKQGWIVMEEPIKDQINNFARFITGGDQSDEAMEWAYEQVKDNIEVMDPKFFDEEFNTDDILEWISIRAERGTKLFLFDHLNWAFDSADDLTGRDPWPKQRKFVKRLARICQDLKITVILVAHCVKGVSKEMNREDRVAASKAVMEVATRGIWVENTKDGFLVEQIKVRGLKARWFPWILDRTNYCFKELAVDKMSQEMQVFIADEGVKMPVGQVPSYYERRIKK